MVSVIQRKANSKNSQTHGLTKRTFWIDKKDWPRFRRLYQAMIKKYQPQDAEEWQDLIVLVKMKWSLRNAANYPSKVKAEHGEDSPEAIKLLYNFSLHFNRVLRASEILKKSMLARIAEREKAEAKKANTDPVEAYIATLNPSDQHLVRQFVRILGGNQAAWSHFEDTEKLTAMVNAHDGWAGFLQWFLDELHPNRKSA